MLRAVAVLGDHVIALVKKIGGDIRCFSGNTVERIVDVRLELAASEFPEIIGGNKERTVEQGAFAA